MKLPAEAVPVKSYKKMIDPPSGWKYGFPKEIPEDVTEDQLGDWLLNNGYPKEHLKLALEFHRYWYEDETT